MEEITTWDVLKKTLKRKWDKLPTSTGTGFLNLFTGTILPPKNSCLTALNIFSGGHPLKRTIGRAWNLGGFGLETTAIEFLVGGFNPFEKY